MSFWSPLSLSPIEFLPSKNEGRSKYDNSQGQLKRGSQLNQRMHDGEKRGSEHGTVEERIKICKGAQRIRIYKIEKQEEEARRHIKSAYIHT